MSDVKRVPIIKVHLPSSTQPWVWTKGSLPVVRI